MFPPRARRVIQIFCPGAVSQMDTFEYKPELIKRHGQPMPGENIVTFQGGNGSLMRSPWDWKQHGQCGKWVSDLLPHLAECVDDIAFVHSLTARSNTHGPAMLQMNTGFVVDGFPSMGAWATYALGTTNQDLPAFVAIPDMRGLPPNGPANWGSRLSARRVPGNRVQHGAADRQPAIRRPVPTPRRRGRRCATF